MADDRAIYWAIFGERELTRTVWVRDPNDTGRGVPFVLRELDDGRNEEIAKAMGAVPSAEEKGVQALRETLVQAVVRASGMDMPESDAERREIIKRWPRSVVVGLNQACADFQDDIAGMRAVVESDPNPGGANAGPSFAPATAGPAGA